jgi:pyrroloquinoline quinone biosynthesis protein B
MIDNERVKLGEYLTLTPILVPHRDEFSETVGFSVASNEKNLLFIPDIDKWDRWHLSLDQIIGEYDHLLLDGTFYDGRELPGRNMEEIPHPFVVETNELLKALSLEEKEKVQFIHLNHTNPLLNQDSKEYQEVMLSGYRVARRGDLITLY